MQVSKSHMLRCGVAVAVVLWVGWAIWQCQCSASLIALDLDITKWCSFSANEDEQQADREEGDTMEVGWPLLHTHEKKTWRSSDPTAVRCDRTILWPGMIFDVGVWCLVLVGTACVVWRWVGHVRQWRLRTLFGIIVVVAILLGWRKYEYDHGIELPGVADVIGLARYYDAPLVTLLLDFDWYVYVPVLFGFGCGIYWIGWMGGKLLAWITVNRHVAMPKLW
jgi:hypothetical protein